MSEETFDQWAIVELFGHARLAGRVTSAQIGGAAFIRVDVPAVPAAIPGPPRYDRMDEAIPAFTRFLGPGAIYSINPVDEVTARRAVVHFRERPIERWRLPETERLVPVPVAVEGWSDPSSDEQDEDGTPDDERERV